ncbi:MAG: type III-A CRISPR-associated RAMP protein Csm4 [Candidatus Heimdallarchaeaceae archaeon]
MISKRISLCFKTGTTNHTIHSNMLSRAIIKSSIELYGGEIVNKLIHHPFATTDLLPFVIANNGRKEYLLPKPLFSLITEKDEKVSNYKAIKKARYITEKALNNFIKDNEAQFSLLEVEKGVVKLKDEKITIELISETRPRNALLRAAPPISKKEEETVSNQFFFTELQNIKKHGYYFIITAENENIMEILVNSIKLLRDRGLGGDISTGFGTFEILDIDDYSFGDEKEEQRLLLSHWIPGEEDKKAKIEILYYDLLSYSPISLSNKNQPLSLKSTTLICSGSIIRNANQRVVGTYKNIGFENEPSLSWGYAITKGVKNNE